MLPRYTRFAWRSTAIVIAAVATLSACGGGGSGDSAPVGPTSPATPSSPTGPSGPASYSVSGRIEDGGGAEVRLAGPTTASVIADPMGNYSLGNLPAGRYSLSVVKPGSVFEPVSVEVEVLASNVTAPTVVRREPLEGLSVEDMERIDATPESALPADKIILPNGQSLADYAATRQISGADPLGKKATEQQGISKPYSTPLPPASGPQQKKNDVIAKMLLTAQNYACARGTPACTTWDYAADTADPDNKPAQTGLTYVYNGKTPEVRTKPSDGCKEMTHGVDCSGLLYKIAEAAGIGLPTGTAAVQGKTESWKLPDDWKLQIKAVSDDSVEAGDIVVWDGHIGIAMNGGSRSSSSVNVISATGAPGQCTKNINPPRGPRSLPIDKIRSKAPTAILRLVTTLSGDFDIYLRCTGESTDAAVIRFSIDNEKGGPFTASGFGVDYNGEPLCFRLDGDYTQDSNTASGSLTFCDGSRSDTFSVKLLQDETSYFDLTKVVDNEGCAAQARLVRVTDPAAKPSGVSHGDSQARRASLLPNRGSSR